jgi:tetratricopeptide (TPR) repeat protein
MRRRHISDPGDALKQLGANLVVKGSVERDGNDIRLTVNLIDTKNLRQVGSAMVEDPAGDLSTLEDEAVSRLAKLMNISVTADMLRNTGGSLKPAAYEDYLTALGYTQRFDKPGNLDLAATSLQKAIQTDPGFALGYAELGEVYRLKYTLEQNAHWLDEALAYCQKAAELDNRVPATYVTLALIHDALGKHDLALQEFQHALELDPKNAAALIGLARSYEQSGRVADAEKAFKDSVALRPEDWSGFNKLGAFYDRQGKYPQAIAAYQEALKLTPDNAEVYSNLGARMWMTAAQNRCRWQSRPCASRLNLVRVTRHMRISGCFLCRRGVMRMRPPLWSRHSRLTQTTTWYGTI